MVKPKLEERNPIIALTNNEIDVLMHSVTCQGVLAVGIAKQIGITFPFAEMKNWRTCRTHSKNKLMLLGDYSASFDKIGTRKYGVINLYGQVEPGPMFEPLKGKEALKKALQLLGTTKRSGKPIRYGITLIGTEFNTISEEQSIALIIDALEDLFYMKELQFDLTIYKHET